jgi:hypothetical protein
MGQTKFQKFIFTLMMCFSMVLGMTIYNMLLNEGWSDQFFFHLFKEFWLGFFIALILDIFVVAKVAKPIAFKIVRPAKNTKPLKLIIAISSCMIIGMVLCMSLYGAVMAMGFTSNALKLYPLVILRNFVVALPLNLLIVSPVVRTLFINVFPQTQTSVAG